MGIILEAGMVRKKDKVLIQWPSVELSSGKFYSVVGMNGSGKSSLVKAILKILPVAQGRVLIDGRKQEAYSRYEYARKMAYVPQFLSIDYTFTVEEVVKMGRYQCFENKELLEKIIGSLSLESLRYQTVTTLSGGEFQRVQIARALYQETPYIVLDEPMSSLDIAHTYELYEILKKLVRQEGKTVILVTHDLAQVRCYCDEMILLYQGAWIEMSSPEVVLTPEKLKRYFHCNINTIALQKYFNYSI